MAASAAKPLLDLGDGVAPTLDYNLPQSTELTANAKLPVSVPAEWFLPAFRQPPDFTWWTVDRNLDDIVKDLDDAVSGNALPHNVNASLIDVLIDRPFTSLATSPAGGRVAANARPAPHRARRGRVPSRRTVAPSTQAVANAINENLMPVAVPTLGGNPQILFIPPPVIVPRFYLVEEYKIAAFLGQYGAGKTLSAFSLLPDEETEISVRTYEQDEVTSTSAQNILDSFSQSSADELEHELSSELGQTTTTTDSTSYDTHSEYDMSLVLNPFDLVNIGGSSHSEIDSDTDTSTVREDNATALERSLSKHVAESSYSREIEISSSTTSTSVTEQEQSTVRRIRNINHSRVLNFVWRQLLQAYETITYLNGVKVVFTTGDPASTRVIELSELRSVLPTLVLPDRVDDVMARLLGPYTTVFNHESVAIPFLERVERVIPPSEFQKNKRTVVYYRKRVGLSDTHGKITVPGVILGVKTYVLPTSSAIVEALLSEGEALDRYNQDLQAATVDRAQLENRKLDLALDTLDAITDPETRAQAWVECFAVPPPKDDVVVLPSPESPVP